MVLHLGDLEVYSYDAKEDAQRHLKYVLEHDNDFRKYVTKKLEERLRENPTGGGVTIQLFLFSKIQARVYWLYSFRRFKVGWDFKY